MPSVYEENGVLIKTQIKLPYKSNLDKDLTADQVEQIEASIKRRLGQEMNRSISLTSIT